MSGYYFNGNVDLSGNIAGLVSGADTKNNKPKYIANAQFSQYIRLEGEVRYYLKVSSSYCIGQAGLLPALVFLMAIQPHLPFIKQFFSGGNNSIRAFRSRSVGPGTYKLQ